MPADKNRMFSQPFRALSQCIELIEDNGKTTIKMLLKLKPRQLAEPGWVCNVCNAVDSANCLKVQGKMWCKGNNMQQTSYFS